MNKKASSILMILFEVLAVSLIIFVAFKIAYGYANSDSITKVNIAKDLSLMVNTLVSVPGDALVPYPENVSKYIIVLNDKQIIIKSKDDTKIGEVVRNINLPLHYTASGIIEQKLHVCFEKKNTNLLLKDCNWNYNQGDSLLK